MYNERTTRGGSSQIIEFRGLQNTNEKNGDNRTLIGENIEVWTKDLIDRIARKIGGLIGTINMQIQGAINEAIYS